MPSSFIIDSCPSQATPLSPGQKPDCSVLTRVDNTNMQHDVALFALQPGVRRDHIRRDLALTVFSGGELGIAEPRNQLITNLEGSLPTWPRSEASPAIRLSATFNLSTLEQIGHDARHRRCGHHTEMPRRCGPEAC